MPDKPRRRVSADSKIGDEKPATLTSVATSAGNLVVDPFNGLTVQASQN
jgi:hypothetical protein